MRQVQESMLASRANECDLGHKDGRREQAQSCEGRHLVGVGEYVTAPKYGWKPIQSQWPHRDRYQPEQNGESTKPSDPNFASEPIVKCGPIFGHLRASHSRPRPIAILRCSSCRSCRRRQDLGRTLYSESIPIQTRLPEVGLSTKRFRRETPARWGPKRLRPAVAPRPHGP